MPGIQRQDYTLGWLQTKNYAHLFIYVRRYQNLYTTRSSNKARMFVALQQPAMGSTKLGKECIVVISRPGQFNPLSASSFTFLYNLFLHNTAALRCKSEVSLSNCAITTVIVKTHSPTSVLWALRLFCQIKHKDVNCNNAVQTCRVVTAQN